MAETPPSPGRSLLFAMGQLVEQSKGHSEALNRLDKTQQELPQRISDTIQPQLVIINSTLLGHTRDIARLSRQQYLWMGGGTVVVGLVGYAIHLAPSLLKGLHP